MENAEFVQKLSLEGEKLSSHLETGMCRATEASNKLRFGC